MNAPLPHPPDVASPPVWLDERRRAFDNHLTDHLAELKQRIQPNSRLLDAVEYSLTQGGKRLRPILALESCEVCGGVASAAWPAALAMECLHTFSLIHDDLPAMDDDDLRRGAPTNHRVFGEAAAILAGDWLAIHALGLLADSRSARATEMVAALADGSKAMIVGQGADIAGEQQPTNGELVTFIHLHKTAKLIETSCVLGALSADAGDQDVARLATYGRRLGIAFQIVDDLLDVSGESERMGKQVRKDADVAKQTFPAAFGVDASRRRAAEEIDGALAALDDYGPRAERLREIARFVLSRDH